MLITGIVLCILGILMLFTSLLNFVIMRYEWFHKSIRKKDISIDKEGLSKFYSLLFFITGIPLLIGGIIGIASNDIFEIFGLWLFVAVAAVGVLGIVYCNLSNRFIIPAEDS